MKSLKIGNLEAQLPIVQGGMGVGISLSNLAGTVASQGGIGVISTAQIGYREQDWDVNPLEANLRAIYKEISKAKEIRGNAKGLIGVNIMVATQFYERYVEAAVQAGAELIVCGAGLPMNLPDIVNRVENVEIKPKLVPIVSTKKAANLIFRRWEKCYGVVPDAIVAEGPRAGGHLGFGNEEIEMITEQDYKDELKTIFELVREYEQKYNKNIPVVVAGGISDKAKADEMFEIGADAIQIATPFVATEECDAHINYKMAYVNCKKEDIKIIKSPVGMPARAINNKFLQKVSKLGRIRPTKCHKCVSTCKINEIPYCITDALVNAVKGNVDEGLIFCGEDAYKVKKIEKVEDILKRFID